MSEYERSATEMDHESDMLISALGRLAGRVGDLPDLKPLEAAVRQAEASGNLSFARHQQLTGLINRVILLQQEVNNSILVLYNAFGLPGLERRHSGRLDS
jgi:hypothetical protein